MNWSDILPAMWLEYVALGGIFALYVLCIVDILAVNLIGFRTRPSATVRPSRHCSTSVQVWSK